MALENYKALYATYGDLFFTGDLLFESSESLSLFFQIRDGYFRGIDKEYDFLKGPVTGGSIGAYFYWGEMLNYFKCSFGFDFFRFRDENITVQTVSEELELLDQKIVGVKNSYIKPAVNFELKLLWDRHFFIFSAGYSWLYWIDEDKIKNENSFLWWRKRRVEHMISAAFQSESYITDELSVKLVYNLKKNISNIGDHSSDYTDYDFTEHIGGLSIVYYYE